MVARSSAKLPPVSRPALARLTPLPLLLAWALTACVGRTPDPLAEAGRDLLVESRLPSDRAFADLNRFVAEQPGLAATAAAGLVEAEDEGTRYAAVYVLALAADGQEDLSALRAALDDEATHLRALAAGSLVGLGEIAAIPVLIELLTVTDQIPGSIPATFVDRFASGALSAYTGQDFGILDARSGAAREAARERWRDWWTDVADDIRWEAASARYVW